MCFEFISAAATAIYFDQDTTTIYYTRLQPFLALLFNKVFDRQIDAENKIDCYGALFMLACIYKDNFSALMQTLIANEANPVHALKIQTESVDFMAHMDLVNNRAMKTKFCDKFDKFVISLSFIWKS